MPVKRSKVGYVEQRLEFPCEHATRAVIPSIRAVVARILVNELGFTKYAAAKVLDVTPAAISNYISQKRGEKYVDKIMSDRHLYAIAREIALMLSKHKGAKTPEVFMRYKNLVCAICSQVNVYAQMFGCEANRRGDAGG